MRSSSSGESRFDANTSEKGGRLNLEKDLQYAGYLHHNVIEPEIVETLEDSRKHRHVKRTFSLW